jgi:hypothetical protein
VVVGLRIQPFIATLAVGGFGLCGIPMVLIQALLERKVGDYATVGVADFLRGGGGDVLDASLGELRAYMGSMRLDCAPVRIETREELVIAEAVERLLA